MNKILNFIIWPAIAGLVFGLVLLQLPRLANVIPGLSAYLPKESIQEVTTNSFSYADAISKAAPAVVSINSTAEVGRKVAERYINPFTKQELYSKDESSSLGSGVIISTDGYIITSYHIFKLQDPDLVFNPNEPIPHVTATLYDGRSLDANLIAVDEVNDLALLKIDETNLAYLTAADEFTLDAGDIVLAIGNPRNIGQSVTLGIISALLSTDDSYVIQTDAAINPGNSGGALIDVNGKLVGINSTIVSESGGSEGISFAVPAGKAFELMQAYIDQGPGGFLGVEGRFISRNISRMIFESDTQGLLVEKISKNGPADKAGLKVEDIITELADIAITDNLAVTQAIQKTSNMKPGDTVIAKVNRQGEETSLPIILGVGEAVMWWSEDTHMLDPYPFGEGMLH